ncbi:MAG: hypothetical protein RIR97_520 [Pseudomonadota bacterium]|jgi:drug/metabolite transporter (DMT)-like permease
MADISMDPDEPEDRSGKPVSGHQPTRPMTGILWTLLAVFIFAGMDATTKHLAQTYPVPLIAFARYLGNLILLSALVLPWQGTRLFQTKRTSLVLVRAACLAAATLFAGLAMRVMPVAETTALVYFQPLGVVLLAGPLLGEKVDRAGWIAAFAGLVGVLIIVRPGSGLAPMGVLFALLTAAVSIGYNLLSRVLAKTETTMAMLFYTAVIGTVIFAILLPLNWSGPAPTRLDTVLFFSIGAMALAGHYCFTTAMREAPASIVAPVTYMHLVWAGLFGWLVFDHIPDSLSVIGCVMIAASGAGLALKTRFSNRHTNSTDKASSRSQPDSLS